VVYRLRSIVFVVDTFGPRGCGKILVCGLAAVSCWRAVVSGAVDIFKLKRVDKRLQAIRHGLCRVGIDDKYGAHLAVSRVVAVTVFAH
jgi:hypothetical protein